MANELETMREIRTKQQNIRISLKKREEQNKVLRSKITPIRKTMAHCSSFGKLQKKTLLARYLTMELRNVGSGI